MIINCGSAVSINTCCTVTKIIRSIVVDFKPTIACTSLDKDYFENPYIDELLQGTEVIEDRDTPHLKEFYDVLSFVSGR